MVATLEGATTELDANRFFRRGIRLIGSTLRSRTPEMKAEILRGLEATLWAAFAARTIRPVMYATLRITEAEAAHVILQRRENPGRVVLTVR